ncbi:MAG: hypothetical protein K6D59_07340 [Bacteroidales bacterium]|nr:hypothetical protein [Bacteroidales bacterium]
MRKIIALLAILMLMTSMVSAQKVYKVQTIKEKKEQKKDQTDYKWKLYVYDDGTSAAFTMSGKRITPNVLVRPFYCGGGLFKVFSKKKDGLGFSYIALYDQNGNVVISDSLSCLNAFYQGDDCVKLMKKKLDGTEIYAAYTKNGICQIPFDPEYTFIAYYPEYKSHWCSDVQGNWYTYNESCDDYALGKYNLAKDADNEKFISIKKKNIRTPKSQKTQRSSWHTDYKENIEHQGHVWSLVCNNGYSVLFDTLGNAVIPLSRGYNTIKFVPVIGHVGYFVTKRNGETGVCDINGNELLSPRYVAVEYNGDEGFCCKKGNDKSKKSVGVWLDINGMPCEKKYKDCNSVLIDTNMIRQMVVCPAMEGYRDVVTLTKYIENGVVSAERLPKSKGYSDIQIHRDGPYVSRGDTHTYYTYYVFKDNNQGVYDYYRKKAIITPDRGYTNITTVHIPNNARNNIIYYLVAKGDKYGACDERGKEIVAPVYSSLIYDENKGFVTKSSDDSWRSIGVYFNYKGKAYNSSQGNLYQKYSNAGDISLNNKYYYSAKKSYSKALKYDESPYTYYNYGVALYNNEDYRRAEKAFNRAYSLARYNDDTELAASASGLSSQTRKMINQRSQRRWESVAQAGLLVLGATAAVVQASMYNNPSVGIPGGYPTATNYNYDQVFNQIMAQTIVQTNVQMAQQQQFFENMLQITVEQVEQQNRAEYNSFVITTGSNMSYEEFMQLKAQVWAESQQNANVDAGTESGGTYDNSRHEEIRQKNREYYDRYGYKDCPQCSIPGNGICKTCNGTGLQDAFNGFDKIECANCKSNKGKCRWCGGTGKVYGLK